MKGSMSRFRPIIVEPKYQGNIGSIARLSRNFGIESIILVNPPDLEDEAIAYSMHGRKILDSATIVNSFDEARELVDFTVGSSGVSESGAKNYHRNPIDTSEFVRWTRSVSGSIGIAFGREDFGLFNKELDVCDLLVTIPADPEYPVLNLSHSVGIVLYELFKDSGKVERRNARSMSRLEKETLLNHYDLLMDVSGVQEHKKPIARTNFRRMVSRSGMNYREFNSLMGTFSRAMEYKREKVSDRKQR